MTERIQEVVIMRREGALKVVLVLVGLLFCAGVYPLILMVKQDPALAMMMKPFAFGWSAAAKAL